jgi:hypothetical protein
MRDAEQGGNHRDDAGGFPRLGFSG